MHEMCTVAVIDDEKDAVTVFSDYLEIIGVKVVGKGYDGKEAVELYERHQPDAVFLDLMMPGYDGFYAFKRIRAINPHASIVIVTADVRDETTKLLDELKPTWVLYKPYDLKDVQKALKTIIHIKSTNSQSAGIELNV